MMNHRKIIAAAISSLGLISMATPALAHVEYYDLNQGAQIGDLTAAGKAASTAEHGSTPSAALALANAANGISTLSSQSDLALSNSAQWNSTYQSYTGVGAFSGVVYTPTFSSATVNVNDVTDFGWGAGTNSTLGDSHKVDFFNFRLAETSTVTISWNVGGDGLYIDNGFSLYSGLLSYQGHDDANEKLNPKTGVPPKKVQDALDTGSVVDVQGIASAYRNTLTGPTYVGQFNALDNWGQSNVSGNWSNVSFITAVNEKNPLDGYSDNANDTFESLTIVLGAGNYTIAASGALGGVGAAGSFGLTNLNGQLNFSATALPVPEPESWALMLSGLAVLGGFSRRRAIKS